MTPFYGLQLLSNKAIGQMGQVYSVSLGQGFKTLDFLVYVCLCVSVMITVAT